MQHNSAIHDRCAAEDTARAKAKVATELLLASLQRHHPEFVPETIAIDVDDVAELVVVESVEMALKQLPPEPEFTIADWVKRQQNLNPIALKPEDPDAAPYGIPIRNIQNACANHYGLTVVELVSVRRSNDVVRPRQVAMYLAKKLTTRSLPEIGRRFGGRDHTTVLHAVRKIERLLQSDADLAAQVDAIRASLS